MNLSTQSQDGRGRETMLLTDSYYVVENSGWGENSMPILVLCGRNEDGERRSIRVHSFRPRFYISEQEFVQNRDVIEKQLNKHSSPLIDYGQNHVLMDGRDQIEGVMLVCELPTDVRDLREEFERHWEADIPFSQVFRLEKGIDDTISIPRGVNEVHHEQVKSGTSDTPIHERTVTFDIEVRTDGEFPDFSSPTQDITAITAYDSATDEYWSGVLKHESWSDDDCENIRSIDNADTVTLYTDDKSLCYDYVQYLRDIQPDLITGWNSSGFDVPYFINRALKLNVGGVEDLSPTKDVEWISDERSINYSWKGVLSVDAMDMYQAVTVGQEKSYGLDFIAQKVLGKGKEEMDEIDNAWENNPRKFLSYNIRDVEAVVDIIEEKDMLMDFRGRRELTSCALENANYPKNLIDPAVLGHGRGYLQQ